ncbi:MAG: HEAT repeat domain-containing protein [Planctomycetota bacterium]
MTMTRIGSFLLVLCVAWGASYAHAEDGETMLAVADLPAHVRPQVVDRLLTEVPRCQTDECVRLATALRASGGHAAADGLRRLLRSPEIADDVRQVLSRAEGKVAVAATETLGRVGDGRDVPFLLDALVGSDAKVAARALRALRELSGARLPASPARWRGWWEQEQPRARSELEAALVHVEAVVKRGEDPARWREVIARQGWTDVESVARAATTWLQSCHPAVRAEGFHVVASLRLAGLAPAAEGALPFVDRCNADAAVRAVRVLGLSTEHMSQSLVPPGCPR